VDDMIALYRDNWKKDLQRSWWTYIRDVGGPFRRGLRQQNLAKIFEGHFSKTCS